MNYCSQCEPTEAMIGSQVVISFSPLMCDKCEKIFLNRDVVPLGCLGVMETCCTIPYFGEMK